MSTAIIQLTTSALMEGSEQVSYKELGDVLAKNLAYFAGKLVARGSFRMPPVVVLPAYNELVASRPAKADAGINMEHYNEGRSMFTHALRSLDVARRFSVLQHVSGESFEGLSERICGILEGHAGMSRGSEVVPLIALTPDADNQIEGSYAFCTRLMGSLNVRDLVIVEGRRFCNSLCAGKLSPSQRPAYSFMQGLSQQLALRDCSMAVLPRYPNTLLVQALSTGIHTLPAANRLALQLNESTGALSAPSVDAASPSQACPSV